MFTHSKCIRFASKLHFWNGALNFWVLDDKQFCTLLSLAIVRLNYLPKYRFPKLKVMKTGKKKSTVPSKWSVFLIWKHHFRGKSHSLRFFNVVNFRSFSDSPINKFTWKLKLPSIFFFLEQRNIFKLHSTKQKKTARKLCWNEKSLNQVLVWMARNKLTKIVCLSLSSLMLLVRLSFSTELGKSRREIFPISFGMHVHIGPHHTYALACRNSVSWCLCVKFSSK